VTSNVSNVLVPPFVLMNVLVTESISQIVSVLLVLMIPMKLTVQSVPTDVLPVLKTPTNVPLVLVSELQLKTVHVQLELMKTLPENVNHVLTNVLIVVLMLKIVTHVLVTD
jgi:hypothetical protein